MERKQIVIVDEIAPMEKVSEYLKRNWFPLMIELTRLEYDTVNEGKGYYELACPIFNNYKVYYKESNDKHFILYLDLKHIESLVFGSEEASLTHFFSDLSEFYPIKKVYRPNPFRKLSIKIEMNDGTTKLVGLYDRQYEMANIIKRKNREKTLIIDKNKVYTSTN